jgi:hypothetical protein
VITAHLTRTPWKEKKLQSSPWELLPVFLGAAGRSTQLEADLLPGEDTQFFFVAVLSSTADPTCIMNAERPGQRRWPLTITSPGAEESDASKTDRHQSLDDESPRRSTEGSRILFKKKLRKFGQVSSQNLSKLNKISPNNQPLQWAYKGCTLRRRGTCRWQGRHRRYS